MKKIIVVGLVILSISAQSQNVGIGTNSPISKLTIQTPINTTGFTHIGGSNEVIVSEAIGGVSASFGTTTNHAFRLSTNNTARISIYPAGEVVVGDNNFAPLGKFAVQSPTGTMGITNSDGNIVLATFLGGTQQFAYIGTTTNHPLSFYTNNSQSQAILMPNGNFGIGTNFPAARLHVAGSSRVDGNSDYYGTVGIYASTGIKTLPIASIGLNIYHDAEAIRIAGNQSYITFFNGANYKGYLWNKGADDMEFGTAGVNTNGRLFLSVRGTPYLTIDNAGRISVSGPVASFTSNFKPSVFTVSGPLILKDNARNFNEWAIDAFFEDLSFDFNGISKSYIDIDGDFNTFSDRSLKDNFEAYKPVLDGIQKLAVSTYHYKSNATGKRSFGLIAQDVASYFPEIVSERIDASGNKTLAIAYAKTGVLAIKAIQEQQQIIEQQQKEIDELKRRLERLEKAMSL